MEQQHLFLLCGLPFSGKSTMGRAMQEQVGIVHVEVDSHVLPGRLGFDELGSRRIKREEWIVAYQAAYRHVEAALEAGRSVVFDAVSYRRTQRERIRRIAAKHDVPMTVVYLDVSPAEAKQRLAANRENPVRGNVPDADFADVAAGMQFPLEDEQVVRYRPNEPVGMWIERVIVPMLAPVTAT